MSESIKYRLLRMIQLERRRLIQNFGDKYPVIKTTTLRVTPRYKGWWGNPLAEFHQDTKEISFYVLAFNQESSIVPLTNQEIKDAICHEYAHAIDDTHRTVNYSTAHDERWASIAVELGLNFPTPSMVRYTIHPFELKQWCEVFKQKDAAPAAVTI